MDLERVESNLSKGRRLRVPKYVHVLVALLSFGAILTILGVNSMGIPVPLLVGAALSYPVLRYITGIAETPYVFISMIPLFVILLVLVFSLDQEVEKTVWFWGLVVVCVVLFSIGITRANSITKKYLEKQDDENGK
tara:strand:+ start:1811 stop:2218 length:408 start_codon:yes stop_codon:yes gene_type:complete